MNYWLDLFTGTTWEEYRKNGGRISGFRSRMRNTVNGIQAGDILLCYLTGVMRWVGALKVVGRSKDKSPIWKDAEFPERLEVKPVVVLDPECGVPMEKLEGQVEFYRGPEHRGKFKGFVRRSPNRFKNTSDGELVLQLLTAAASNPNPTPVDPAKLARKPFYKAKTKRGKKTVEQVVSVPEPDEIPQTKRVPGDGQRADVSGQEHTQVQAMLMRLGAAMGFNVWVARNDRSKKCDGQVLADLPNVLGVLPRVSDEVTNKIIELIDVLWLKKSSIVAAFEIECTTSVYSGLLRMSDLLSLNPNLQIDLYIVASEERRTKVRDEILRPTFSLRETPLVEVCGFLPIEELNEKIEGVRKLGLLSALNPEVLKQIAVYFNEEGEDDGF